MEPIRIIIAQPTITFASQISLQLRESYHLYQCRDGVQTWICIQRYCPAVLVLDLSLPGVDGLEILRRLQLMDHRPKVLLTTCTMSPYIEETIAEYDVDMLMVKPCSPDLVADRVRQLAQSPLELPAGPERSVEVVPAEPVFAESVPKAPPVLPAVQEGEETIASILLRLRFSPKRKGYEYLQTCVEMFRQDPCAGITKQLYPMTARKYNTNLLAVERAIRQAILGAWEERDDRVWQEYFLVDRSGTVPRPTNAEFIARLAEYLKAAARKRTM